MLPHFSSPLSLQARLARAGAALRRLVVLGPALLALAAQAAAGPNDVQDLVRAGEIMPFEAIQRRVMQEQPGEYMGSDFQPSTRIYRFRFMKDGDLINIDVDARTGQRVQMRKSF